jgi:hypothetical protein
MPTNFRPQGPSNRRGDVARIRGRSDGGWADEPRETFFAAAAQICRDISFASTEALASELDGWRERNGRLFLIASAVVPPCDRSGQSAFGKRVWGSWVETAAIRLSTAIWWS